MQTTTQATPRTITGVSVSDAIGTKSVIISISDGSVRCATYIATFGDDIVAYFAGKLISVNARTLACKVIREGVTIR